MQMMMWQVPTMFSCRGPTRSMPTLYKACKVLEAVPHELALWPGFDLFLDHVS